VVVVNDPDGGASLHLLTKYTRGSGPRLFPEDAPPKTLTCANCESYETGVVYLAYRPR